MSMALALLFILGVCALGPVAADGTPSPPHGRTGRWPIAQPRPSPSASSICHEKTETYRDFPASRGRPQGHAPLEPARRTSRSPSSKSTAGSNPPGGESRIAAGCPGGSRAGSRGRHRQQVRHRDAASADRRRRTTRACLGFMKRDRRARLADLRLVVPGRNASAGAPRRDRLHAEPADPAHRRKRPETGGIVRPRRTEARRLPHRDSACRRTG